MHERAEEFRGRRYTKTAGSSFIATLYLAGSHQRLLEIPTYMLKPRKETGQKTRTSERGMAPTSWRPVLLFVSDAEGV